MVKKSENMDDFLLLLSESPAGNDTWEPGFEAGRHLVQVRLGPIDHLFLRPSGFRQRFYHRLYSMPVETWQIETAVALFSGLCTIEVRLKIRFQATLRYAEKNPEAWEEINRHIRAQMEVLIFDVVEARVTALESGDWIETGLHETEKQLAMAINETLALNDIQCRALCSLKAVFADPAAGDREVLLREEIVQAIMKKQTESERLRFQIDRERREESLRQELEQIRFALESSARKQVEETEGRKSRLQTKRRKMAELREIERKLHQETLQHQSKLEQMVLEKQLRDAQKRRELESQYQSEPTRSERTEEQSVTDASSRTHDSGDDSEQGRLLKDLEWEAANKLREKEQKILSLEERLQMLMAGHKETHQMTVGHTTVSHNWLDLLGQWTGRLLFFIKMRR